MGSTLGCPYSPQNNIRNFEHSHFHITEAINVNGIHLYLIYLIYKNSNIKTTFPVSHLLIHVCLMAFLLSYLLGALDTITSSKTWCLFSSSFKSVNGTIMLFHFNDFLLFLSFSSAFANIFLKGNVLSCSAAACGKFGLSASVKVTSASAYWLRSCRLWSLFHLAVTVLVHCHHTFRELSSVVVTVFISTMTFCRYLFLVEAFVTDEGKNNEYCPENLGDAKEIASRISTWKPLTTFVCNVNLTFVSEVLK